MTELHVDLDRPDFVADPYPTYHKMRAEAPIWWHEDWGRWLVTRYRDVQEILRRAREFRTSANISFVAENQENEFFRSFARWFVFQEHAEHKRLRELMKQLFTLRALESYRPAIQQIVDELVDQHAGMESMEFNEGFAHPVVMSSLSRILSLPVSEAKMMRECIDELSGALANPRSLGDSKAVEKSYKTIEAYLQEEIHDRRKRPRDDFISRLVGVFDDDHMIIAQCVVLLIGGYESTPNILTSSVYSLLSNPSELQKLKADPSLARSAFEESMRYESPVQFVTRSPAEDREVGGHRFEKGQKITLLLGAANRDPAIFSDPDRLDITRSNSRNHLAFGWGAHLCVGAPLARLEGEIVLDALMRRFPTMRLADADGVRWKAGLRFRGLESLKVAF